MRKAHLTWFIAVLFLVFTASCTKEESKDAINQDFELESTDKFVQDDIDIEGMMEDLFMELEDVDLWIEGMKSGRNDNDCRTITIEPMDRGLFPKTITVDFGDGCEVREGVVKKGKIVIEVSAAPRSDEWTKTIRFVRYSVNGKLFEGGKNITFMKEGRAQEPTWKIKSRLKVHWGDGTFLQQTVDRTRVQARGSESPFRYMDDAFLIAGTTTGVNRAGEGFRKEITEPLHVSRDCLWIRKGLVSLQVRGESAAVLDYGDGTCDNLATITKDGETREIKLRRK